MARARENNYAIQLINLKIQRIHLDIAQEFSDLKETDLKAKRKTLKLLQLEIQRQDIFNNTQYQVYKSYFQAVISAERRDIAQTDIDFHSLHIQEVKAQYTQGKIDEDSYKRIQQAHKQKEELLILAQGEHKRSLLALTLHTGIKFQEDTILTTDITEDSHKISIENDLLTVPQKNRYILQAARHKVLKSLEHALIDKKYSSQKAQKQSEYHKKEATIMYQDVLQRHKNKLFNDYLAVEEHDATKRKAQHQFETAKLFHSTTQRQYKQGYIPRFQRDSAQIQKSQSALLYKSKIFEYNLSKLIYAFNLT